MSILRPATPGFLVTLTATILLALVTFGVPINKSVFFLKASLTVENIDGSILLGTLGYCLELNNGTSCTKPAVGYSFGKYGATNAIPRSTVDSFLQTQIN